MRKPSKPQTIGTDKTLVVQKGNCLDCPCYTNCPRMKGSAHCYSSPTHEAKATDKGNR